MCVQQNLSQRVTDSAIKGDEDQESDPSALYQQQRSFEYNDLTSIDTFPGAVPYPNCSKRKAGHWTGEESKK